MGVHRPPEEGGRWKYYHQRPLGVGSKLPLPNMYANTCARAIPIDDVIHYDSSL